MNSGAPGFLRARHQQFVQAAAGHRVDVFAIGAAVREQCELSVERMRHAAQHRHGLAQDVGVEADLVQRVQAAGRDGEVDRAAGGDVHAAHVGAAFVDVDRKPALRQRQREQRADRAGADDDEVSHGSRPRGVARRQMNCTKVRG